MAQGTIEFAERVLAQLREEMLEAQRTRAQVIGFKITLVSTGVALLGAKLGAIPPEVLAVPAVAAVFFDLLINAYSVSIKRIGLYLHHHLEPMLRAAHGWPEDVPTWEEFARSQNWKSWLFLFGNLGLTALAAIVASVAILALPFTPLRVMVLLVLALLLVVDFMTFVRPQRLLVPKAAQDSVAIEGEA